MEKTITATKHWFRVSETTWQLLVEVNTRVFHKTVIIYDTRGTYTIILATNKKLKEFDLIEQVWKELGIKLKLI
jgi:predicted deacetylase